nr:hypothetical protein CFP56_00859 [Quercus suber]
MDTSSHGRPPLSWRDALRVVWTPATLRAPSDTSSSTIHNVATSLSGIWSKTDSTRTCRSLSASAGNRVRTSIWIGFSGRLQKPPRFSVVEWMLIQSSGKAGEMSRRVRNVADYLRDSPALDGGCNTAICSSMNDGRCFAMTGLPGGTSSRLDLAKH